MSVRGVYSIARRVEREKPTDQHTIQLYDVIRTYDYGKTKVVKTMKTELGAIRYCRHRNAHLVRYD